jgi:hypothetical protein
MMLRQASAPPADVAAARGAFSAPMEFPNRLNPSDDEFVSAQILCRFAGPQALIKWPFQRREGLVW